MSIIISLLSKIAIKKIWNYIKDNKKEFIMIAIILIFVSIIFFLLIRIRIHKSNIVTLENQIDTLIISNELLNDNITKYSNDIIINKSFEKVVYKIIYKTNDIYYTNADDIELKEDKREAFYFNKIFSAGDDK
jgi:hypothetical protein